MAIKSRKHPVARTPRQADTRTLVLAALPGIALAGPALAQEQRLGTVSVTETVDEGYKADVASSPKFTAPLLDTPQTVTVIRKELLDDQGVGTLAEALRNTPGITFTLGENGNTTAGDSITMRGFDTSGSIFLDGVRDLGAISRDTFNIEQVEIVKGPSGSDNGRGAPTGYINQSSKQPTLERALSGSVSGGSDSHLRFEGDLNQPLTGIAGAAVRLNLMYDKADKPGRDFADNQRWGIAPSFALGLDGDTRAYFSYLFIKQINTPDGGIPTVGLPGYGAPTTTGNPPVAVDPAIVAALDSAAPVDSSNFYGSADDYEHVRGNMFTVKLEHDLSQSSTLRNISRYGRYSLQRVITGVNAITVADTADPGSWTVNRSHQRRDEVNELLTNQTSLTTAFSTGGIGHSLSTGAEFIYERHLLLPSVALGTQAPANLYNPGTGDSFTSFARSGARSEGKTLTGAVYLFDTLRFSGQWSLNAGVRFDRYRTESAVVPAPATPPAASSYVEGDGNLFTGKIGLVFKPVENGSLYAAFATSEQPPGGQPQSAGTNPNFSLGTGSATNNPNVDPQEATNIEIGTKWDLLDNRLVLTAAAFDTRNKNDVIGTQDPITGEYPQSGERKVRGFELAAAGAITANWQVNAGLASMKTRVVEGTAAQTGAQLQYSPKLTFTSWTTYTLPMGLRIGGGARYVDSSFRNGNATQASQSNLAESPSYWVVDLMAGYDVNEQVSLQLNVQNVTDKFYLASLNNGGSRYTLGTPRTVLLTGRVKFY